MLLVVLLGVFINNLVILITIISVINYAEYWYAECLYAECLDGVCLYAECLYAECLYAERIYFERLNAEFYADNQHNTVSIVLNVIMLSDIVLNVIMGSVFKLNVNECFYAECHYDEFLYA